MYSLRIDTETLLGDFARQGEATELRFIASGMSMYPFIVGGRDMVRLRKRMPVKESDIVAAHIPGRGYVLHRVYGLSGSQLTLMGDGNISQCELCSLSDVVGVLTEINGRACDSLPFRMASFIWRKLRFLRRGLIWSMKKCDPRL